MMVEQVPEVAERDRQREVFERYTERLRTARAAERTLLTQRTLLLMFDLTPLARPVDPLARRALAAQVSEADAVTSPSAHLRGEDSPVARLWTGVDPELITEVAERGRVAGPLVAGALADWPRPGRRKLSGFVAALAEWVDDPAEVAEVWVAAQCESFAAGESTRNAAQRTAGHAEASQRFVPVVEAHAERFGGAQGFLSRLGLLAEQHECGGPVGVWLV